MSNVTVEGAEKLPNRVIVAVIEITNGIHFQTHLLEEGSDNIDVHTMKCLAINKAVNDAVFPLMESYAQASMQANATAGHGKK